MIHIYDGPPLKRRDHIKAVARELAAYYAKHPGRPQDVRWRLLVLTGGGDGYSDHELDFLERAVRFLNRRRR